MRVTLFTVVAGVFLATVSSRAVNISSTWMLPEEGFPVFYRYFRDRISWNEADAVCQFHHANLVTVDSTSQYDAIRAYLKELDITNNVWIGLSRAADKATFSWRDFRPLSATDHWQEAIPNGGDGGGGEPLCAAMDPAADFRWHALTCAGPEVAAFICELPVPAWANGANGCLITDLPSLTVLYMPEQSAVELTSDCGQGGTKRIVCKGNANRDEITQRLACTDDSIALPAPTAALQSVTATSTATTTIHLAESRTTKPDILTSNTVDTGDYGVPTRHRRETEETSASPGTVSTSELPPTATESTTMMESVNAEEYPSAINQGQLFSIIENGTLFDIIELNGTDENKTLAPDAALSSAVVPNEALTSTSTKTPVDQTKEALPDLPKTLKNTTLPRTYRKQVPIFRKPDVNIDIDVTNDIEPAKAIRKVARIAEVRLNADAISESTYEAHYNSEPTTKPNRQRQLTRSNRRSFYPYFFSRVLG